jgi:hypothetical protein
MGKSLSDLKDTARDAVLILNRMTDADIPLTLRDAVERDWNGAEAIIREIIDDDLYQDDKRKADRQRVIPLRKALEVIDELRAALEEQTKLPGTSVVGNLLKPAVAAKRFVDIGRAVWRSGVLESAEARSALALLWEHLMEVLNAVTIARFAFDSFNHARKAANVARSRALPQRNGPRYSRRKRARL